MITFIYRIPEFLRTTAGRTALLLLAAFLVMFFVQEQRERKQLRDNSRTPVEETLAKKPKTSDLGREPVTISNRDNFSRFQPLAPPSPAEPIELPPQEPKREIRSPQMVFSFRIQPKPKVQPPVDEPESPIRPAQGSLIPCRLVHSISSDQSSGPIIGIVLRDHRKAGKMIIPKGSRIFGTVAGSSGDHRVTSDDRWNVLTPRNHEISFTGHAMASPAPGLPVSVKSSSLMLGLSGVPRSVPGMPKKKNLLSRLAGTFARTGQGQLRGLIGSGGDEGLQRFGRDLLSGAIDRRSGQRFHPARPSDTGFDCPAGQTFYVFVSVSGPPATGSTSSSISLENYLLQRSQLQNQTLSRP